MKRSSCGGRCRSRCTAGGRPTVRRHPSARRTRSGGDKRAQRLEKETVGQLPGAGIAYKLERLRLSGHDRAPIGRHPPNIKRREHGGSLLGHRHVQDPGWLEPSKERTASDVAAFEPDDFRGDSSPGRVESGGRDRVESLHHRKPVQHGARRGAEGLELKRDGLGLDQAETGVAGSERATSGGLYRGYEHAAARQEAKRPAVTTQPAPRLSIAGMVRSMISRSSSKFQFSM